MPKCCNHHLYTSGRRQHSSCTCCPGDTADTKCAPQCATTTPPVHHKLGLRAQPPFFWGFGAQRRANLPNHTGSTAARNKLRHSMARLRLSSSNLTQLVPCRQPQSASEICTRPTLPLRPPTPPSPPQHHRINQSHTCRQPYKRSCCNPAVLKTRAATLL